MEKKPDVGGQAVIEGVMMRAPQRIAVAVRKPSGEIALKDLLDGEGDLANCENFFVSHSIRGCNRGGLGVFC